MKITQPELILAHSLWQNAKFSSIGLFSIFFKLAKIIIFVRLFYVYYIQKNLWKINGFWDDFLLFFKVNQNVWNIIFNADFQDM